jgi:hypothetical protein
MPAGPRARRMVTVERRELLTTVTPMLTLGYDAR